MKVISTNRKARHDYSIEKSYEAGIELRGSEVKSLRGGHVGFSDSFAKIKRGEIFLINLNIPAYEKASLFNHDPKRQRRLLMHKQEIRKLEKKTVESGFTLVPLSIYFNDRGLVKVELGLARGKKTYDKKAHLMDQQNAREAERAKKHFSRKFY